MSAPSCHREADLLAALGRGFIAPDLASHVAECASCSELQLVAGLLLDDRAQSMLQAPIPSAAAMWWRVQLRSRQEAESRVRQSLLIGQAASLLLALGLMLALLGADVMVVVQQLILTIRLSTPLLLLVATGLLLAPIAGLVAIRQK